MIFLALRVSTKGLREFQNMKISYAISKVAGRPWHKLYLRRPSEQRVRALDTALSRCSGDYMIKKSKSIDGRTVGVLIAEDEDFVLVKMGLKLFDHEYHGFRHWDKYYPMDSRTKGWAIPRTTREPHPMAR